MPTRLSPLVSFLTVLAGAVAQGPGQPPPPMILASTAGIVGQVTDHHDQPLEGAVVRCIVAPRVPLASLAGWEALWAERHPEAMTRSNSRGGFRLPAMPGHGALLIRHPAGTAPLLGALVLDPHPTRVRCHPLGELEVPEGTQVYVRPATDAAPAPLLGAFGAPGLRLPAGEYSVLVHCGDRLRLTPCRLLSGRSLALTAGDAAAWRLACPTADAVAVLRHWPDVPLPRDAKGSFLVPGGGRPQEVVLRRTVDGFESVDAMWIERDSAAPPLPRASATVEVVDADGQGLTGATVLSCSTVGSRLQLHARDRVVDGRARVLAPHPARALLLVYAPGHAAVAVEDGIDGDATIALAPGFQLPVQLLSPIGDPGQDVLLEASWGNSEHLCARGRTDHVGRIVFAGLPAGRVSLRVLDPHYLARSYPVIVKKGENPGHALRGDAGFEVNGRVTLPSGRPAAGAVVTLRDTTGQQEIQERRTVTDALGRFVIGGLPEHGRVRLAATYEADGLRFISQQERVTVDGTVWDVELKHEDPRLPGRAR